MAPPADPTISVVIPTFQRDDCIETAVRSVLDQDYEHFEIVVADDGSTDTTAEVVAAIGDSRVHHLALPHAGRSAARNRGAEGATGEVLTFLDSDDRALPGWLAALARPFADPAVGIVCCGQRLEIDQPLFDRRETKLRMPRSLGPMFDDEVGLFLAGTYATRRDLFLRAGGFDEDLSFSETTELTHRLLPAAHEEGLVMRTVQEALVVYHFQRPPASGAFRRARLEAIGTLLDRHADRYRRDRRACANLCGVAAVDAMGLGRGAEARRWALLSVRAWPRRPRSWLRLALSLAPSSVAARVVAARERQVSPRGTGPAAADPTDV